MNTRETQSGKKKAWPTKEAMEQVYALNLWGGREGELYSGSGSHLPALVDPYVAHVVDFLQGFPKPLVVCDLGCGDFNVGNQLHPYAAHYHAVDIVPALIELNQSVFKATNLSFNCLDIANDELPEGDCLLLRQVLQHLSNPEIQKIITKLYQYKYLIITEHVPHDTFVPNLPIISGQGIRLKKKSGVDILEAPFNFSPVYWKVMMSQPAPEGGIIRTRLFQTA